MLLQPSCDLIAVTDISVRRHDIVLAELQEFFQLFNLMKIFTCVSTSTTSATTQLNSEMCSRRSGLDQERTSPASHGRFFIFGIFAPLGAYFNQGGCYPMRRDHNQQITFHI